MTKLTILFVCTGNTCRSPMAMALMRRALDKRNRKDIIIESAGLSAHGQPAALNAILAIAELDNQYAQPLKAHISQNITADQLDRADFVAVMSSGHAESVAALGKDKDKIHILSAGEVAGIADPFGGDMEIYRKTRDQLEKAVESLADIVCSKERI
ncbi:MAG: low molecular weight phosphatase family protein [Oscillospiraceae bacterium]|jgi:protein-tyrosine-phosphatase|nr:low molecular weight phosphatase family protein [Oscillospiraceae bacterium]